MEENNITPQPTPEEKKNFAKAQLQFLREKGITDGLRLSRVFKAAGPGQVQESWSLANQAQDPVKKDLLDCILTGAGGCQGFGKERMEASLKAAGFTPPQASSAKAFFRILDGAMEILVPGSYEFTEEEVMEIEEGLARSREKARKFSEEKQEPTD